MKNKLLVGFLILALAFGVVGIAPAFAQAYTTSFTTSITYQNVDTQAATSVQIYFYPEPDSTTPIIISRPTLNAGAGTSLFIGSLTEIDQGFRGSAIMLADRRLVATLVQVPQSTVVQNRPLSNGFESGSPQILLATVLKNAFQGGSNSVFSVQNTDTEPNTVDIKFYNTNAVEVHSMTQTIQDGASYYVDTGQISALGSTFNGSAVIDATRSGGGDGSIVATVMELNQNDPRASAFESAAGGGTTFYMPSALCNAFNPQQNSAYAVQNTSLTNSTSVTVEYSNGATETKTIQPGSKQSFITCDATGMNSGFSGSAKVTSSTQPIVAIMKVYGAGLSTAALGAESGAARLALPYVRWTESRWGSGRQRTFIAIQNVSGSSIAGSALSVKYYDKTGSLLATHTFTGTIPDGGKVNSDAFNYGNNLAEFGYYADGSFGGSAIVECSAPGCEVVAVARVNSLVDVASNTKVGEDYNGIAIP